MAHDIENPQQSSIDATDKLVARAGPDSDFRQHLPAHPRKTIETEGVDVTRQVERFIDAHRDDGSWTEYRAFGGQSLRWGVIGQIGHGSEPVTSALCIEALGHMISIFECR